LKWKQVLIDLQCKALNKRKIQSIEVEKVEQIGEGNNKDAFSALKLQKVPLFVCHYDILEFIGIVYVVVVQVNTEELSKAFPTLYFGFSEV
jgi:hypothetical protein